MTENEPGDGREGDHTTELDRNLIGTSPVGLPFAFMVEPTRGPLPPIEDGVLPFRPPSIPPPAPPSRTPSFSGTPVPESTSLSTTQRALPVPPTAIPPIPQVPIAPPSPPGIIASLAAPVALAPPALLAAPPTPRPEFRDVFRRAFGMAHGSGAAPDRSPTNGPATTAPESSSVGSANIKSADSVSVASARNASDAALPAEVRAAAAESRLAPVTALQRRAVVDLLAFDPTVPGRLRRSAQHAPLLAAPAASRSHQGVDAPAAEASAEERARHDILRVLSCGSPMPAEALAQAFEALLDDALELELPLFLVEGEVSPTMDELEALRAIVEHAKPLAGSNKRLLGALSSAGDALARSTPPSPEAALQLYTQIDAGTADLGLPTRHLAKLVDRTLRETRSYKRRTLLGATRIRATLTLGSTSLPIYLPNAAADLLPLLPTFRLTALVESRPREDACEQSPTALVACAVGRVLRARGVAREG